MYENLYEKITDALVNDGYIIIENALEPQLSKQLLKISNETDDFKKAGISNSSLRDENRRRDKIKWLDADTEATTAYLNFAEGLQAYLNRSLYLGLRYYEAHFAVYESGDFYEKHLDTFQNSKNRVVTTVYYLNEAWDANSGGELIIYDKNSKEIKRVVPKANTLVVFMSEDFPHEVLPAKAKRSSIAGWFRIDRV
jgi:SM-20-related protein